MRWIIGLGVALAAGVAIWLVVRPWWEHRDIIWGRS